MANQAERILESDERKSITSFRNQGNKENSNIPAYPFIGTCTGGVRFKETRTHRAKAPCILLIIVYSAGWSALATSAFRFPISMFFGPIVRRHVLSTWISKTGISLLLTDQQVHNPFLHLYIHWQRKAKKKFRVHLLKAFFLYTMFLPPYLSDFLVFHRTTGCFKRDCYINPVEPSVPNFIFSSASTDWFRKKITVQFSILLSLLTLALLPESWEMTLVMQSMWVWIKETGRPSR